MPNHSRLSEPSSSSYGDHPNSSRTSLENKVDQSEPSTSARLKSQSQERRCGASPKSPLKYPPADCTFLRRAGARRGWAVRGPRVRHAALCCLRARMASASRHSRALFLRAAPSARRPPHAAESAFHASTRLLPHVRGPARPARPSGCAAPRPSRSRDARLRRADQRRPSRCPRLLLPSRRARHKMTALGGARQAGSRLLLSYSTVRTVSHPRLALFERTWSSSGTGAVAHYTRSPVPCGMLLVAPTGYRTRAQRAKKRTSPSALTAGARAAAALSALRRVLHAQTDHSCGCGTLSSSSRKRTPLRTSLGKEGVHGRLRLGQVQSGSPGNVVRHAENALLDDVPSAITPNHRERSDHGLSPWARSPRHGAPRQRRQF